MEHSMYYHQHPLLPFHHLTIHHQSMEPSSPCLVLGILILIYTGCRIGELLELKKEDIHLDERWFYVKEAKTQAGIREVPIAEKIVGYKGQSITQIVYTHIDLPYKLEAINKI